MKDKKIFFILLSSFFILIILGISLSIILSKPGKEKKIKESLIKVQIETQGELDYIPNEIPVQFSRKFLGAEGIVIEEEEINNFIQIEPFIKSYGKWVSENTFIIYFSERPELDRDYTLKVLKIPLKTEVESITPIKISFKTPPFKVLNASLLSVENKKASVKLEFNESLNIKEILNKEIKKFLKVIDSKNNEVEIVDIQRVQHNLEEILLTFSITKAPEKYRLVVLKGLKSTRGFPLKEDYEFEIPIGFHENPISVLSYNVEEIEEGFMITFNLSAPGEEKFKIINKNLSALIRINPPISFKAQTSQNYIYILGNFSPDREYEVILKSGIKSEKSALLSDYKVKIKIPEKKEVLQFLYRGRYFGKKGDWKLPLKISQIDSLKMDIVYVPPQNVLFWYSRGWGEIYSFRSYGEEVVKNYKLEVEENKKLLWIDLKDFLKEIEKGIYLVEVFGKTKKNRFLSDRIFVCISDISLIVKWSDKYIYVWALSSSTLEPEQNVNIEIRSSKNFLTGKGITDINGFCKIAILKKEREPYIVFAEKDKEWTYMHIPSLMLKKEEFEIYGEDPYIPYLAYIYPERNLYRPGEEIHFAVIVREPKTFKGVSIPLKVIISDPRGKNALSLTGNTDQSGIAEFSFPTTPASPTGKYMIDLQIGDRILTNSYVFVETFVPEKMSIDIKIPEKINIYEKFPVNIKAEYLFGAPASNESYSIWIKASEIEFKPSGYYGYSFGTIKTQDKALPYYQSERIYGKLDEKGEAEVFMQIPKDIIFYEPINLDISVEVTEGGSGRVSSKSLSKIIHQRPFYIGLISDVKRIREGIPVKIKGVLLKPDGSFYTNRTKLTYRVYMLKWSYSYYYYEEEYEYYEGDGYWESRFLKIPVSEEKEIIAEDGKFSFTFTPQASYYDYLIEVSDEKNLAFSELKISGWGWWYEEREVVESPEIIPISVDKKEYDEGEIVNVEALLPFEGKILWTVELDSIYIREVKEYKGELAKWSFKAPRGVSNVYVSALLIRSGENYLVQRAYGIQKIRIRPKKIHLDLKVEVPEKIKPGEELLIKVKGGEKFKGTISIVDEGILQITSFKTPDPYNGILKDLRLILNTAESFGWIIKKFLEKTGGGLTEREEEFVSPRFTKLVSYWSGIIESSPDGKIEYKVKIPQYNGKLRIMISGVNENKLGNAEKEVIVKSDVIVSPTIPRFMCTKDEFSFPVTIINTTKLIKKTEIKVFLEGAKAEEDKFIVTTPAEEKNIIWINCKADNMPGSIKIKIEGNSEGERYYEDFEIPLYPNTPYITKTEYVKVTPDKNDLSQYFEEFYPKAHEVNLILAPIPGLTRLNHLKYVISYPYGCIEQTSTKTFLLIKLKNLLPFINPEITQDKYTDMVNSGIRRIISMQTPSGGFAFWPGGGDPEPWASAYATLVLIESEKEGFFVPEGVIEAALNYLDAIQDKNGLTYYVLARGGYLSKKKEYLDRIIALSRKEKFDVPSGIFVCGAINEAGKKEEAKNLLEKVLKEEEPKTRRYSQDFYSPLQYKGMKLFITQTIDPSNSEIERLLIEIGEALSKKSFYYTTQELAWCLAGLGMYMERFEREKYEAQISIDGKKYKPYEKKGVYSWFLKNIGGKKVFLEIKSKENLYLCIENSGFSKREEDFKEEIKGLHLKRKIFTFKGEKTETAEQGDLLVIKILVKSTGYYENVAIESPIPAGLEIVNPRIEETSLPFWVKRRNIMTPTYVDIRDDRIILFGSVTSDTLCYYYLARAVTPGKFYTSPVRGFVMYNPEIMGNSDAFYFKVNKK
ncbi:MAG: MG2 domain-containing protein [candidate division WOR-3 bacterium]